MHSRCVKHMKCWCSWCYAQVLVTVTPGVLQYILLIAFIRLQPRWRRVRAHPWARSCPRGRSGASSWAFHRGSPHSPSNWRQAPVLCITNDIYATLLHLMFVGLQCALKCRSWVKTLSCMNSVFLFEMDTSMLGRVAALLTRISVEV
jgi:hypothetical protein